MKTACFLGVIVCASLVGNVLVAGNSHGIELLDKKEACALHCASDARICNNGMRSVQTFMYHPLCKDGKPSGRHKLLCDLCQKITGDPPPSEPSRTDQIGGTGIFDGVQAKLDTARVSEVPNNPSQTGNVEDRKRGNPESSAKHLNPQIFQEPTETSTPVKEDGPARSDTTTVSSGSTEDSTTAGESKQLENGTSTEPAVEPVVLLTKGESPNIQEEVDVYEYIDVDPLDRHEIEEYLNKEYYMG